MPNRLANETSPYLLQHANNPVDWYAWGPEALERAKNEDKPILLSIGYAACHWCHVMERESFENEDIAKLMNQSFVCIKVDREERPDLDEIYMAATVAMSGGGGWPMTVFLTPDQQPFFAGTYFPPTDKYGRPGFGTLLTKIAESWQGERDNVEAQARELTEHVRDQNSLARPASVGADHLERAVQQLSQTFDARFGGFGSAPKFPPCSGLLLLLRQHAKTADAHALEMVTTTLDGMKNGGMYDHVGGGFARYSTDERWLVPHFEKMLYDNAQLTRVYLEAYQVTKNPEYRRVASETLDYVVREMQSESGGYFSATDADSEGEEGKFFVWQPDEIVEILGVEAAERFCLHYDIHPRGNWEGKSIANTPRTLEETAKSSAWSRRRCGPRSIDRGTVYEARAKRVPPLLDDKILTAWNGLMIGAMAEGYRVLSETRWLESAERAAKDLALTMTRPDLGLYRTARAGKAHLDAYLEDYAYLGDALLDLYEAGGPPEHLATATRLADRMLADFGDAEAGAFYFTAHGHESLIARTREGHDGAVPNPNAVAARLLSRLARHSGREELRERAIQAIRAYGGLVERSPRAFATTLVVTDFLLAPPLELVLVGSREERARLARAVAEHFLPNRVIAVVDPKAPSQGPLVEGKTLVDGKAALYVCRDYACRAPVTRVEDVPHALGEMQKSAEESRAARIGGERLAGAATPDGTRRYQARFDARGFVELGTTGLVASRLGFGCYRVDDREPDHRASLVQALTSGVNLIDTSTNYTDGGSERLVGEVLLALSKKNALQRDEIIVVSKIGYAQGKNLELAMEREKSGTPFPETVKVGQGIWHSMHPTWIEDQLTRSLERLGLDTLDVCLLHNPEYFFTDAVRRGQGPMTALRDEFYARLEKAFAHFEKEIERGRIRHYGVSSNTCVAPADDREATDLGRMLAVAKPHFRLLQLPANLLEPGALLEKNNAAGTKTVLDLAREKRIAVLVNRPLNAIVSDGLIRLADAPLMEGLPPVEAQLARLAELEGEFRRTLAPKIRTGQGMPPAESLFDWAEQLGRLPSSAQTLAQWNDIETQVVVPRVLQVMSALDQAMKGDMTETWRSFRDRYGDEIEKTLLALRRRAAEHSRRTSERIQRIIDPLLPAESRSAPFSQKALSALGSVPGVSVVLVGMRRPEYVTDALGALGLASVSEPARVFEALQDFE